jgi:hypothetical protein
MVSRRHHGLFGTCEGGRGDRACGDELSRSGSEYTGPGLLPPLLTGTVTGIEKPCWRPPEPWAEQASRTVDTLALTHPDAVDLVPLHHQVELLVDLVVLCLGPRSQGEVGLVVAVLAAGAPEPAALLLLVERLGSGTVDTGTLSPPAPPTE